MNVICYKRVSTDEQADKGFSLQFQEEMLIRWCETNNHKIVGIYTEDASAKTFNRPEWKKIVSFVKKNKKAVDIIACHRWDRFSRNALNALNMISELAHYGVTVNTVEQPLDLSNPDNKILLSVYLSLSEIENDRRSKNAITGSRKARSLGHWTGTPPLGYKIFRTQGQKGSTLIPSDNAKIVTEAFERMASGNYSADEVRRWVNSNGLKISKNQFYNIIRNITYTGKIYVKESGKEPALIVEGLHNSLVTDELFAAANQVLRGRKRKMTFKNDKADIYPLKGHLKCKTHNLSLTGGRSKGRYGLYDYYLCTVKHDRCKRYPVKWVHEIVEKKLGEIQFGAGIINSYKSVLSKMFEVEDADRIKSINQLKSEIEKLEGQKNVLQLNFLNQKITAEEYREMKQMIDSKSYELKSNLSDLEGQVAPIKEYLNNHIPMLENILEYYQKSDGKTKNKILSCILSEKISFDENKDAAIHFNESITRLMNISNKLQRGKKEKEIKNDLLSCVAPPVGLEPTTL